MLAADLKLEIIDTITSPIGTIFNANGDKRKHILIDKLNLTERDKMYLKNLFAENVLLLGYCVMVKFEGLAGREDQEYLNEVANELGAQHICLVYHNRINNNISQIMELQNTLKINDAF